MRLGHLGPGLPGQQSDDSHQARDFHFHATTPEIPDKA